MTDTSVIVTITKKEPFFYLGKQQITEDKLTSELTDLVKKNPQITLAIRADTETTLGQYMKVYDAASEAQIKSMKIYTQKAIQP